MFLHIHSTGQAQTAGKALIDRVQSKQRALSSRLEQAATVVVDWPADWQQRRLSRVHFNSPG
jgi:hypothetical protein